MDFFKRQNREHSGQALQNAVPPIRIPLSVPCFDQAETESLMACMQSGIVSTVSPMIKTFETHFRETLKVPYAVAVQSGTAALHLALLALGIGPGDEVIVPAISFTATVNPVRYLGTVPVFVDIDPITFALNPRGLEKAITPNTKAIMVSHLFGMPARIQEIQMIARQHHLPLIEDAAEALGATVSNQQIGTFGTIGCFSFNGNKTITTGGGGMVVTHEKALAERILHLSTQAKSPGAKTINDEDYFEISHDDIGYNYRMTGLQAAVGLAQLNKLDFFLYRKQQIAKGYAAGLSKTAGVKSVFLPEKQKIQPSYWLSTLILDSAEWRNEILREARMRGIEFRPFFKPLPLLEPYRAFSRPEGYPQAEALWRRALCLPSSVSLTETEQQEVIRWLRQFLDKKTEILPECSAQALQL